MEKNNIPHVANGGAIVEKEVWGTGSTIQLLTVREDILTYAIILKTLVIQAGKQPKTFLK